MDDNTAERWLPVVGRPDYEVSDLGRFRRGPHGTPRVYAASPTGHIHVGMRMPTGHSRLAHRIVMAAFVGPCPQGLEVCHNNGDAADNRLSNLRYGSRSDNIRDSVQHRTQNKVTKTHCAQGHEYNEANTRTDWHRNNVRGDLRPMRVCRVCERLKRRRQRAEAHRLSTP